MLEKLQRSFATDIFSEERFTALKNDIDKTLNMKVEFRIFEGPMMLSTSFRKKLEEAAVALVEECITPEYLKHTAPAMEERYTVPHQHSRPIFSITDFAVTQNASGEYEPKLIELQGFPSLFGFQFLYAQKAIEHFQLDSRLKFILSDRSPDDYLRALRNVLLSGHNKENVVLLEYQPDKQKTRPDFIATELFTGVPTVDICSVKKEGKYLFYERDGKKIRIERIYNRAIIDELDDNKVEIPFKWSEELDVEWAGHPNWYFLMSKYSMAFLKHKSVPKTHFLHEVKDIPADIENYVLKPLYAFAGKGVNVSPTHEDVKNVPAAERDKWILQERVHYAEKLYTPEGGNKAEIRIMLIWEPEAPRPVPYISLLRTGRGPMLGSRYNNVPWTGASGCFFGDESIFG